MLGAVEDQEEDQEGEEEEVEEVGEEEEQLAGSAFSQYLVRTHPGTTRFHSVILSGIFSGSALPMSILWDINQRD